MVQRFEHFFPVRQDEAHKDKQGSWKQAWPDNVRSNGQKRCATADKPLEEQSDQKCEDMKVQIMPASSKDRDLLTPSRKKVK